MDFTSKLSAKWKLHTRSFRPLQPKTSADSQQNLETIFRQLIAIPTTTGNYTANHDALDYIEQYLSKRGMHTTRLEWNGIESLIATVNQTKTPKVMLAAHLDVVPGPAELFELKERDGKYFGRGVLDMKYAIAAYMQTVDSLKSTLQEYDFGIMITTDEEAGGTDGVARLAEDGYLPQLCILPDGGMNWQIQLFSKGTMHVSITANGLAAHGSRPWLGESAIDKLLSTLAEVKTLFPDPGTDPDVSLTTHNIGEIKGGNAVNQVADSAEATLDIRFPSNEEKASILRHIEEICVKNGTNMQILMSGDITSFKLTDPFFEEFAQIITEKTGVKVVGSRTPASSDIRYYTPYKVPCISVYPPGGGHHGPEEWISKEGVYQFEEIIRDYLRQIAREP